MTALKGSEKQVKWAEQIRAAKLTEIYGAIEAMETEAREDGYEFDSHDLRKIRYYKVAAYYLETLDRASDIIDAREHGPNTIFGQTFYGATGEKFFEILAKKAGV